MEPKLNSEKAIVQAQKELSISRHIHLHIELIWASTWETTLAVPDLAALRNKLFSHGGKSLDVAALQCMHARAEQ